MAQIKLGKCLYNVEDGMIKGLSEDNQKKLI